MKNLIIKEVIFNGATLVGILKDGKIHTPLKKFWEFLGIDFEGQRQRIRRDETLIQGACKIQVPSEGGIQETLTLEISFLPLWLTGIKSQQCKEEVRKNLIKFKLEAKDVLSEAFFGKREKEIPLLPEDKEKPDWVYERITEDVEKAKGLEDQIEKLLNELYPLFDEIAGVANLKKKTIGYNFFNFKSDDEEKKGKTEIEIEKKHLKEIEKLGLNKDEVVEKAIEVIRENNLFIEK